MRSPSGLPQVFADAHQVQQVLLNLVINAEQAMLSAHGRGTLVVRTWHEREQGSVVLEINDDGPGVPDDVRPKIFDPFFTTKEVGKGTGLGLTVAYAIVQEHGGRIRVESPQGAGRIVLRRVAGEDGTRVSEPAPNRPSTPFEALAGTRVLVVEDEPALAAAVAEALNDAGFRGRSGGRRRRGARPRGRALLRSGDLRSEDAAGRRDARSTARSRPRRPRSPRA